MESNFRKSVFTGVAMLFFSVVCLFLGVTDGGSLAANTTVFPPGGGAIGIDETTTVTRTHEDSPNLILDQIDPIVTKIRPHDVVLNTISRHVSDVKTSTSQKVRHYSIDVLELTANTIGAIPAGQTQLDLNTSDNSIFAHDQTIIVSGVPGYKEDGVTIDPEEELTLYVVNTSASGAPNVVAFNGPISGNTMTIPAIPSGTTLIRAGRAGSETQLKTDAYSPIVTDEYQYLQKFMMQIEESTLHKIADKEVNWTLSDQEEEAIFDLKRTQNVSFWKGTRRIKKLKNFYGSKAEEIYTTGGIWQQAGKEYSFGSIPVDEYNIVGMMKAAFTGNASSKKKLFIVGSDLLERFEKVDYKKVVYVGTKSQAYGLEFSSIISKFGTLYVIHDQTLDDMQMSDCGFILDADFLRKWTMGWRVLETNLSESLQRDVQARTIIEICGLVLKNRDAHLRVKFAA